MNDTPHPDTVDVRQRVIQHGWIDRQAENFRHLPPPVLDTWLSQSDNPHPPHEGWTVRALDAGQNTLFDAQWLDPAVADQRAALYQDLPWPDEGDAAHFGWVHRATCQRGLRLHVGDAASAAQQITIQLELQIAPVAPCDAPLVRIDVAPGVHCVLREQHTFDKPGNATVQNLDMHIRLAPGAHLEHVRTIDPAPTDRLAHQIHVTLAQDARYDQVLLAAGSAYHLQRTQADLHQPGSQVRIGAALLLAETTLDQQVELVHTGSQSRSAVESLALASGKAYGVLNAHTLIASGADEAQVHQRLCAIPTSGQPRMVLRPHMEINHDQVQAAHGATFGALPEDSLFYARQRGLDEASALALILQGLQRAVLESALDNPELLNTLQLDAHLARMTEQHLGRTTA